MALLAAVFSAVFIIAFKNILCTHFTPFFHIHLHKNTCILMVSVELTAQSCYCLLLNSFLPLHFQSDVRSSL